MPTYLPNDVGAPTPRYNPSQESSATVKRWGQPPDWRTAAPHGFRLHGALRLCVRDDRPVQPEKGREGVGARSDLVGRLSQNLERAELPQFWCFIFLAHLPPPPMVRNRAAAVCCADVRTPTQRIQAVRPRWHRYGECMGRGAYGFQLNGADLAAALLVETPADWPVLQLSQRRSTETLPRSRLAIAPHGAMIPLLGGGFLSLDRRTLSAVYATPRVITPQELVHPYLAPAAAVAASWLGRETFHAGGLAVGDAVWGVLGAKSSGKSSLLGWFATEGHEVFADDALIVDGTTVFAGPRSIDLRPDSARWLQTGEALGVVGERERWRIGLPATRSALGLQGWIYLEWGESTELVRLPAQERLGRLARHRMVHLPPADPEQILNLGALPAYVLRRARSWEDMRESATRLLDQIG
jgi:hypothetical protein